ncbi:hypothetical protein CRM22_010787 [Opisthorchis felineus]|uniref:Uncharacterized protein n=1 Tax=Opisthorchis felineus TaxID=147828 RepID=A0A4S2KL79_OPIFE|nr:hypothetical protein CRM22_010787 [Opisthorchis felineus]
MDRKKGSRRVLIILASSMLCQDNTYVAFCICARELKCHSVNLNNYAQSDQILYCKKHYQENVLAKNTQTPI